MTDPQPTRPPSAGQLRYLKDLAQQRGESFTYPTSVAQASAEIERLKGRKRLSRSERRHEARELSREMAERSGDAAAVRRSEIGGYGASASWR